MKKQLLLTALIGSIGLVHADEAAERAKDHAQPIPDTNIRAEAVTERISTVTDGKGNQAVSTTTEVTVANTVTGESETTVVGVDVIPPEPRIVNAQMDFEQTLSRMNSALVDLQAADTVDAMKMPASVLSEYAGQAALLITAPEVQGTLADPVQANADLNTLRVSVVELQRALIAGDFTLAKTIADAIVIP